MDFNPNRYKNNNKLEKWAKAIQKEKIQMAIEHRKTCLNSLARKVKQIKIMG